MNKKFDKIFYKEKEKKCGFHKVKEINDEEKGGLKQLEEEKL